MAIRQKSREPSFWEVMDSFYFISMCKFGSFKNPSTNLLIYPFGTNKKSDFYELWQQHKQLKTIEMSEASPDTFDERYIHQFHPKPIHKIH